MIIDLRSPRLAVQAKVDLIILETRMKGFHVTDKQVKWAMKIALITAATTVIPAPPALAATADITGKIWKAFKPVIDILRGLGYPIVYVVEVTGALTMFFNKRKGIALMKDGAIAYLVLQFVPMLIQLLIGVGGSIDG